MNADFLTHENPDAQSQSGPHRRRLILDTNVVLDLWLFQHPAAPAALVGLARWDWIASADMRAELLRVLQYPHLQARLAVARRSASELLDQYDARVRLLAPAPRQLPRCKDADDQKFIDLALQQQADLVSHDRHILQLRNRLTRLGVKVWPANTWLAEVGIDPVMKMESAGAISASS